MTRPRVSIGLPVYNGERYLKQAIDSLLAQTFEDFELILSDNASTDGTADICRSYAASDRRIRCVRNDTNIGVYRNFNRTFELSVGEYFKWASADDVAHPNLLHYCLKVLEEEEGVVLVYPKTQFIDDQGQCLDITDPGWDLRSSDARKRFEYVIRSGHWCNLFYGLTRREALNRTRLFPAYKSGDYRLAGELSLLGQFHETREYLFFRRLHHGASSQARDIVRQTEFFTGRSGHPGLPFWHLCLDHAVTVARSDLDVRSKIVLHALIVRRMYLAKRQLLGELCSESLWLTRPALRGVARLAKMDRLAAPASQDSLHNGLR